MQNYSSVQPKFKQGLDLRAKAKEAASASRDSEEGTGRPTQPDRHSGGSSLPAGDPGEPVGTETGRVLTTDDAYHTFRDFRLALGTPATMSQLEVATPTTPPRRGQARLSAASAGWDADAVL